MKHLNYEIKRLEELYNFYKSSNMTPWIKDLILPVYEKHLSKLYTEKGLP